jgi:hypothetical protein
MLPLGLVEQVCGNLDQTGQITQESAFGQPGPLLTWESSERTFNGVRDLAFLQASGMADQRDWVSEGGLALLSPTADAGLLPGIPALLENTASGPEEGADLAGLDAFFAHEAAGSGRSRRQ